MHHFVRLSLLVITATLSIHAAGCESSSSFNRSAPTSAAKPASRVSQQLIIKFKSMSVPCTEQAIARFSNGTKVQLEWLRPMSGDACVVIQSAGNQGELTKGQERLKRHSEIEWLEIDAVMQRH